MDILPVVILWFSKELPKYSDQESAFSFSYHITEIRKLGHFKITTTSSWLPVKEGANLCCNYAVWGEMNEPLTDFVITPAE